LKPDVSSETKEDVCKYVFLLYITLWMDASVAPLRMVAQLYILSPYVQ